MKITIEDKAKIDILVALFHLIKNSSSTVNLTFFTNKLFIQGMDKSHVCLFNISINNSWFTLYEINCTNNIIIDSNSIFTILSRISDNNILVICYNELSNNVLDLQIIMREDKEKEKTEYNRYFQIPLIDSEQDLLNIPIIDYDVEFSLNSKQFHELTSQLILFGEILQISCTEDGIDLQSNGDNGKMTVKIPVDDLHEYSIIESETIEQSYSLNYMHKMCITTKLSKQIELSISNDYPIRIKYDLGDGNEVLFFVAPKI